MAKKIIKAQMKQRRDTLENWAAANPVLLDGELGFIEGFNDRFKVGDGKTAWNDLSYFSGSFNPSGTYPDLTAGDLAGRGESVPAEFGFRASGGKSIKDGRAYIKRIKGNSVVWNQMRDVAIKAQNEDKFGISVSTTLGSSLISCVGTYDGSTGDANIYNQPAFPSIPAMVGHKYLCMIVGNEKMQLTVFGLGATTSQIDFYAIVQCTAEGFVNLIPRINTNLASGTEINESIQFLCYDLTKMFQAGNEPTTIEEFNARVATLGIDMYAYNEGQVIHCNTESIKSVGDNVVSWDYDFVTDNSGEPSAVKNYEEGKIYVGCSNGGYVNPSLIKTYEHYGNGIKVVSSNGYGVGVFVKVLPNAQYYAGFNVNGNGRVYVTWYDAEKRLISHTAIANGASVTSTENTKYALISLIPYYDGVNEIVVTDLLFSLVHSGWKQDTDAGYQPYWQDTLPLPIIRKYFPDGMKKAGSAHDEIRFNKASGKWEYSKGRIKGVNLSSIIQEETGKDGEFLLTLPTNYAAISSYANIPRLLCSPFITNTVANVNGNNLNDCIYGVDDWLIIRSSRYFTLSDIKAAMAGVILYYESNDWEWEELDEADQNFRDFYNVADFGTEMSHSNVPSAAFSADIIYQFNAVDMIREHEAEINELQSIIATMQAQLTSLINK